MDERKATESLGHETSPKEINRAPDVVGFAAAAARFLERRWAVLSVYLLALSYLYLVQYAWSEHIPLRIHLGAVTALLPWLLLNVAVVAVMMVGSVAVIVSVGGLRMKNGAELSSVIWAPKDASDEQRGAALRAWLGIVATPLFVAAMLAIGMTYAQAFEEGPAVLGYFSIPVLLGLFLTVRTLRARKLPVGKAFPVKYAAMTGVALFMFALHVFGFGVQVLRHFDARSNAAISAGLVVYALGVIALIAFWFWLSHRSVSRRDAKPAILTVVALATLVGLMAPLAAFLTRSGLSLLGLGGTVVALRQNGEWSAPTVLLLDMGDEMFMRPCAVRSSDQRLVELVKRDSVEAVRSVQRCPSASQ